MGKKSAKLDPNGDLLVLSSLRLQRADGEDINNLMSNFLAAVSSLWPDSPLKDFGWFVLGRKSFEILGQCKGCVWNRLCVCVGGESWRSACLGPVVRAEDWQKKGKLLQLFCVS